jgi:hypothetical protein
MLTEKDLEKIISDAWDAGAQNQYDREHYNSAIPTKAQYIKQVLLPLPSVQDVENEFKKMAGELSMQRLSNS